MPDVTQEKINEFLTELRSTNTVNMYHGPGILEKSFLLSREEAQNYFWKWTETFGL